MKYLLLSICMFLPLSIFSQFRSNNGTESITSELSPASKLLLEQSQKKTISKRKAADTLGFNLAVTSRFEGGIVLGISDSLPFSEGLFNVTSLEFYMPALIGTPTTRFLTTVRFSIPILDEPGYYSLYAMRLGFGVGFSQALSDSRDKDGRGLMTSLNLLFGADFNFVYDVSANTNLIEESITIVRIDLGARFNYFVSKNFAFVFGLDIGGGFSTGKQNTNIGPDRYPIEPLQAYGDYIRGFFTSGVTIGFMF